MKETPVSTITAIEYPTSPRNELFGPNMLQYDDPEIRHQCLHRKDLIVDPITFNDDPEYDTMKEILAEFQPAQVKILVEFFYNRYTVDQLIKHSDYSIEHINGTIGKFKQKINEKFEKIPVTF